MRRFIYLSLSAFLGVLLGANLAFWLEKFMIEGALAEGRLPQSSFFISFQSHVSPLFWLLILAGAASGWFLGRYWLKKNKRLLKI